MNAILFLVTFVAWVPAFATETYVSCESDTAKQLARSKELQEIFAADQLDRNPPFPADLQLRDRDRRSRVGQIFGEGCINTAKDYLAAAIVFQHGDRPDHFFQTFLFSMRGSQLGDSKQKRNMALGIDRYLTNTNHKQLFASQAFKTNSELCWCLEPVEASFPDRVRLEYMGGGLKLQREWVDSLNKGTTCGPAKDCAHDFAPSPKGTVPGFW